MALLRSRWLPIAQFNRLMSSGAGRLSISKGNLGTTQNDHMSAIADPVGSIYVEPDVTSLKPMIDAGSSNLGNRMATVMARFTDEDGKGLNVCPRATLQRLAEIFTRDHAIDFFVGFEIEVTFVRRNASPSAPEETFSQPLDQDHAWGTLSDEQYRKSVKWMTSIATALKDIGIQVECLHSEAGAGQYEFVLPPLPPIEAVDALIQARQGIQQFVAAKGLRATCHPMPFSGIGTAAHAHISLNSGTLAREDLENLETCFTAGVLSHLRAICAITMPQPESYGRVVDNGWTGGTWVAWGTNNREVPLRRVSSCHWEVRCLDGFANMYLALSMILIAGLRAIEKKSELLLKDCLKNPAKLSDAERAELGISERLPRSLDEALAALKEDLELQAAVGSELIENWMDLKKAEQEVLEQMENEKRRVWLMERY